MPTASLFSQIRSLIATSESPELGPGPRAGVQPLTELRQQIRATLKGEVLDQRRRELVEATVLLWHDHHDQAHEIVQRIEDADGSYLHGILHRREPDYGNARYWFRRVGQHPCFAKLPTAATKLLTDSEKRELKEALLPQGRWDAMAFIELCERAAAEAGPDPEKRLLREIQRAEFEIFLEYCCS
jgi:hypothetical protein